MTYKVKWLNHKEYALIDSAQQIEVSFGSHEQRAEHHAMMTTQVNQLMDEMERLEMQHDLLLKEIANNAPDSRKI